MSADPRKIKGDLRIDGDILVPNESVSRATEVDATGKLKSSATTSTELGYLSGVTSAIQSQINDANTAASDAQDDIDNHISDTADAHDASAISNIPSGNLSATDQQAVNNELQSDIDDRALDSEVIKKDGSVAFTADQSMGSNKLTSVAQGTAGTDAVNKTQMENADALKVAKAGDTMSGNLAMGSNKVTGLATGTNAGDAVNKAQLDAAIAGMVWYDPIADVDLVDDSLSSPPGSPVLGDVYIVADTATGDWTGSEGYALFWDGSAWIDLLGRAVIVGDRFGVSMDSATAGDGGLTGQDNKIATITDATPGAITYSFQTPTSNKAVYVSDETSTHFGHAYNFNGTSWVEFVGPGVLGAGIGLAWDANTLNVNLGAGIAQLPSDEVGVDVHSAGGLMTTVDNSTSSTLTNAQLAIKLNGSTLDKSASGLKLSDTAVSPGSYGSATETVSITVDQQGRITSASEQSISIPASQVSDFDEAAQDAIGGILVDSSSIDFTYTDGTPSITAVVLPAGVDHDSLNNYVANEHIDHSSVSIATAANSGLAGGGDLTSTRNLSVDINGTTLETSNDNADKILIYDNSASALKSMSRADFLSGINVGSAGDITETSFSAANNQAAPANVTGFAFANGTVRAFTALISIYIDATSSKYETYTIDGIQKGSDWFISQTATGDDSGITFSITSAGQIRYTSTNSAGFVSSTIKFRAITVSV
jgi:hypothetical protein